MPKGIIKALSCDTLLLMMLSLEVVNIIHSHLCQVFFFPFFLHNYQNKILLLKESKQNFELELCNNLKI
jgi:hypothetical protein